MSRGKVCGLCHGWAHLDVRRGSETAWNDATGGEAGARYPVFSLHPAFGSFEGELVACPLCEPKAFRSDLLGFSGLLNGSSNDSGDVRASVMERQIPTSSEGQ